MMLKKRIDVKQLCLKKSLFNPSEGLAQSYAARRHIAAADAPIVEVVHYSDRWLLLQAPRYSHDFFRRLNSGQLGNPYEQLLKIFNGFVALTAAYGFFIPTVGMVFMEGRAVRVWTNEDVFAGGRMKPLGKGVEGEREFVVAFLAMVEGELREWERVKGIATIEETLELLDWRSRVHRSGHVRKTKINLISTSCTLERFSQKWPEEGQQPPSPTLHHHSSEPVSIQHEFQRLFLEEGEGVESGVQGNKQQLEKIAKEIQEVLIW